MKKHWITLRNFKRDESAVALIEFAYWLPIMVMMFVGVAELARMAIVYQKVDKVAHEVVDLATRNDTVTQTLLDSYANTADEIMAPFSFDGTIIFSSYQSVTNKKKKIDKRQQINSTQGLQTLQQFSSNAIQRNPKFQLTFNENACEGGCLLWQEKRLGNADSNIAQQVGEKAHFPNGYKLNGDTNIISVEVKYTFSTILSIAADLVPGLGQTEIYTVALSKPRQGKMTSAPQ